MIALLSLPVALAVGESADIELLRPSFSPGAIPGIDSPLMVDFGNIRLGVLAQYTRDPLVLYAEGDDRGAVIARRQTIYLGLSSDLGQRTSMRLLRPMAAQWGSENPDLAGSSLGLADLSGGLRQQLGSIGATTIALRGDITVPTGARLSWLGESQPRAYLGAVALAELGAFAPMLDVGVTLRAPVDTEQDFLLGNEVTANLGLRYIIWPEQVTLSAGLLSRTSTTDFLQRGASTGSELISVVQLSPRPGRQWDIGVGKGLADGYGTSEFRAFAGMTWIRVEDAPLPQPPAVVITELPPEPIAMEVLEEDTWDDDELARIEEKQIVIRDPIQFEQGTARILEDSLPTLHYVAALMNSNWLIGHVVIEGHASEEGSFAYNYDLSIRRARSIFEALLQASVHPDRISYRGMGEVIPVRAGEDEESLAANRRVEFHIVQQLSESDPPPEYRPVEQTPWDGAPVDLTVPDTAPAPTRREGDPLDIQQFLDEADEDTP